MDAYLKAFLISCYHQDPLFFPKRDKLNDLLELLLTKRPKNYKPKDPEGDYVEIILPYFENLNIMSYHYLSENSEKAFVKRVKKIFWVTFEEFMDESFRNDMGRNGAIYLFIEKYDLPLDTKIEDMLKKRLYRSRRIFRKYPKRNYQAQKTENILSD